MGGPNYGHFFQLINFILNIVDKIVSPFDRAFFLEELLF